MKLPHSLPDVMISSGVLDHRSNIPLYRQLYKEIRQMILSGLLPSSTRLPSTRILAKQLRVSRNTILGAFEQLFAEGYVQGNVGSGTYVSRELPDDLLAVKRKSFLKKSLSKTSHGIISARAMNLQAVLDPNPPLTSSHVFRTGLPAMDAFPFPEWSRILGRCCRKLPRTMFGYGVPGGYPPLCESIVTYLRQTRGVSVETDQVLIVSGSQQALDLASRVLIDPGEAAWVEEPGYRGVRAALLNAGARIVPVPVDQEGLSVREGIAKDPAARLVHVSPSCQYPLGVTMTLARRLTLLDWANHADAWILEDDYDSEFRYGGRPLASLKSLDTQDRVLYFGTFSKVLFPALRIGYLIVPRRLTSTFWGARTWMDLHPPILEQAALDEFIREGHFARHVRRMRALYWRRQELLVSQASRSLKQILEVKAAGGGMQLIGWLPEGIDDGKAMQLAAKAGIETLSLSSHYSQKPRRGGLVLGYAAASPAEIKDGVRKLASALNPLVR